MAIDDNTSYELTGAQVKDLASKINAKADTTDLPSVMTGATSSTAGASGLVPAPAAGDEAKVLSGAGTWVNQSGGGGGSSVTYYAASSSTQGFSTYYTYLYSDTARTTVVTPDTILSNFENGDTVLIEFESTGTGSSAYKMTLTVTTMTLDGDNVYRMTVIELNEYNTNYNCVTAYLSATWDGQSSFNGRWTIVRNTKPVVNDGTLTIQHNGTTKGTFTANQSTASTVNIETIYADDYISTSPIPTTVTTAMIEDEAVTAAKTAFGGNYSTTEVDTGFTWIDGKHIYKKTVDIGNLPNATTKNVAHGISNLGTIIKMEGYAYESPSFITLPFVTNTATNQVYLIANVTNITIGTGSNRSGFYGYVTLWYTKSS